jgi:hypothetical protein
MILSSMERGLDGWHVTMGVRREVVLYGFTGALMAGNIKFMRIFILNIARRFDGCDNFCSVCMRHPLIRGY